jgi:hypothetical protein
MAIADLDETRSVLANFESRIYSIIDKAWDEWLNNPTKGRVLFSRTRANIVFDSIARLALEEFGEDKKQV